MDPHPPNHRLIADPPLSAPEPSPVRERAGAGKTKVCVLGAGHGGSAMAGHLTLLGFEVTVCSLYGRELEPVEQAGGVELVGDEVSGVAKYARIERSLDRAIAGQDLIMIAAPAVAHRVYATLLAPILEDGQVVVLNPGRTGGALEFASTLTRFACPAEIVLGEVQTFVYAAEARGPAKVEVLKEKFRVRAAALPATDNDRLMAVLQGLYPQIEPGENVLETSLNNVGGVVHPTTMLLNMGVIEQQAAGGDLRFYKNQVGPSVAALVMEPMDREKQAVGRALRLSELWSVQRWYEESYHVTGDGLWDSLMRNPYYEGFHAPGQLLGYNHILDEIPNSLVPVSELGAALGVPTPMTDAIIDLAAAMAHIDFRRHGRTLEVLGLDGLTADEILARVNVGPLVGDARSYGLARRIPWFG
ncbi:MAG: NAD/NADP octopine/nopaline dehydrogenase family protein [Gaiellales bacterium]